jgi:Flp pilus assembly protein TadD
MTPTPETDFKQPNNATQRPLALLAAVGLLGALAYLGGPGSDAHVDPGPAAAVQDRGMNHLQARSGDRLATAGEPATEPPATALPSRETAVAVTPDAPRDQGRAAERLAKEMLASGRDRLADGDLAGGLEAFESAVEFYPSAETHGALGWLYFKMHVGNRAKAHLESAAMLDPDNADRWIDLANAEIQRTEIGDAWQAIRRAREVEPEIRLERNEDGYFERGDDKESDAAAGTVGGARGSDIE